MDLGLSDRIALVTGGSSGIGRATAECLAREGAHVAIAYCRHAEEGRAVAEAIRSDGRDACALHMNLGDPESIRAAVSAVVERWGRIDILVNNAVSWERAAELAAVPFDELASTEWQSLIRANIEGTYVAIQLVLPAMKRHGWGRIVTVSSIQAENALPGFGWYAASKAAMHGLTMSVAKEVGACGILANVVAPGVTLTETAVRELPPHALARNARAVAIRRLPRPPEVATTIVFLCSAANTLITGEIVRPTGGRA